MAAPLRTGAHRGIIMDSGLGESKGGNPQFQVRLALTQWYDADMEGADGKKGVWCDIQSENTEVDVFIYLKKKDGTANDIAVRQLQESLGWSGKIMDLTEEGNFNARGVQTTVKNEEFNGQFKMKGDGLRHFDAVPFAGVRKVAPDRARALAMEMDAKIAAVAPAAPRPGPPPARATPPKPDDDLPFDKG